MANALSNEQLKLLDAYWRAANYLSIGQIYLYDNRLLKEPLTEEHIKPRHHGLLIANVLTQAEALTFGRTAAEVEAEGTLDWLVPHRLCEGNRPSNTRLREALTPAALGKLVALYEPSVLTQGTIWHMDSFEQWGVGLGKALPQPIVPELESAAEPALDHDSSTNALIRRYRCLKGAAR